MAPRRQADPEDCFAAKQAKQPLNRQLRCPEGERKLAGGASHRISGKAAFAPEGRGIGVDIAPLSPLPGQESLRSFPVADATGYQPLTLRVINDVRASIGRPTFNHIQPSRRGTP